MEKLPISNEKSYESFLELAKNLPLEKKNEYEDNFYKVLNIEREKPWVKQQTLDEETAYRILCIVSTYGRGIEATLLKKFKLSKGFVFHLMTGNGRKEIKEKYKNTTTEERMAIGRKFFEEWELQSLSKNKIKKEYKDLFVHYGIAD